MSKHCINGWKQMSRIEIRKIELLSNGTDGIVNNKKDGDHLDCDLDESTLDFGGGCRFGIEGKENASVEHIELSVVCEDEDELQGCGKVDRVQGYISDKRSVNDEKCDVEFGSVAKEDCCKQKRKREGSLPLLDWVKKVAKDLPDTAIWSLSERLNLKPSKNEKLWKKTLLARELMLLKRGVDSKSEQTIFQKKQKMHPTMYKEHSGLEKSRCSQRIISASESRAVLSFEKKAQDVSSDLSFSSSQRDCVNHFDKKSEPVLVDPLLGLWITNHPRKKIPTGPFFQAKVPNWTGETSESDSKWLGTHSWLQEDVGNYDNLTEWDFVGFGRRDLCYCEFPGSFECVRFHVSEKRIRVKLALGSAFYHWHMDNMGEEVALSWAQEEEKKFTATVRSNHLSQDKCLWAGIHMIFPHKSREELVSYYFNVFLLRLRGHQNRSAPGDINSDNDEPEPETGSASDCI